MKNYLIFTLASLLLFACQTPNTPEQDATSDSPFPAFDSLEMAQHGVRVEAAVEAEMGMEIACTGRIEIPPQSRADLVAILGGYVRTIRPYEGEQVRKGQILLELEHPDFIQLQTEYLEAAAETERASAALKRLETLAQGAAASQKEVDKAQADYATWNVRLASARARLAQLGVSAEDVKSKGLRSTWALRAPFDGYVHDVAANVGSYAAPTDVLMRVENPAHSHIELAVFGQEAERVKPGQVLEFSLNGAQERNRGEVVEVGKAPTATGSYSVHGHPGASVQGLRSGAFVEAWIQVNSGMKPSLPSEAVVHWEGQNHLLLVEDGRITPVPVHILGEKAGRTFFETLPEGRFVVSRPHVLLPVGEAE
jgi:cobalt-zinc-cadmium efflux system membrane fusion protein